jgi:hypothetical protein
VHSKLIKNVKILLSTIFLISAFETSQAVEKLRFIGDVDFQTGEKFMETEIGGLSGLTYDPAQNKLLAVSDDKGYVGEARYYTFDVTLDEKNFAVKPTAVTRFKTADGSYYKKGVPDFEGIALVGKDVLVSSEGSVFGKLFQPPELIRFNLNGEFKENLVVPSKFIANGLKDIMSGTRGNKAFEVLSASLDQKDIFMAPEEALFQDGSISTATLSSTIRIIHYQNLKPTQEYAYQLEKVELDKSTEIEVAENGLVDMAVIDSKNFYSMERSYLPLKNKNIIRIFKNTIGPDTTDVSKVDSLKNASFVPVKKTLLLDLDTIIPQLKSVTKALDNIEGLSFGPVLKNGNRTIIVCSDNNFGKNQRTMFVAFEILKN